MSAFVSPFQSCVVFTFLESATIRIILPANISDVPAFMLHPNISIASGISALAAGFFPFNGLTAVVIDAFLTEAVMVPLACGMRVCATAQV